MQTERKEICNCGHCVERNLRYISEVPTIRIFFCNSHILGLPGICSFICFPLLLSFTKPKNHQTVLLSWDIAFNWFQSRHNCIYLECQKLKKGEFFFVFVLFFSDGTATIIWRHVLNIILRNYVWSICLDFPININAEIPVKIDVTFVRISYQRDGSSMRDILITVYTVL